MQKMISRSKKEERVIPEDQKSADISMLESKSLHLLDELLEMSHPVQDSPKSCLFHRVGTMACTVSTANAVIRGCAVTSIALSLLLPPLKILPETGCRMRGSSPLLHHTHSYQDSR